MDVTGIILAGGKSSRMGTDKGLLDLNGKAMVQYIIDVLKNVVSKVIIIANNSDYEQFNLAVYSDLIPEKGPVGGIYTALHYSKSNKNIIVSCDTPFITEELLNNLLSQSKNYDVVVPQFQNKIHPLIGIYSQTIKPIFEESLNKNELKLGLVNQQTNLKIVDYTEQNFEQSVFYNINTPTELNQHKK